MLAWHDDKHKHEYEHEQEHEHENRVEDWGCLLWWGVWC